MLDLVLSLVMLAAIALLAGAWAMWRRRAIRQAWLMAILAVVMLANVAIWALPDQRGNAPLEQARTGDAPG